MFSNSGCSLGAAPERIASRCLSRVSHPLAERPGVVGRDDRQHPIVGADLPERCAIPAGRGIAPSHSWPCLLLPRLGGLVVAPSNPPSPASLCPRIGGHGDVRDRGFRGNGVAAVRWRRAARRGTSAASPSSRARRRSRSARTPASGSAPRAPTVSRISLRVLPSPYSAASPSSSQAPVTASNGARAPLEDVAAGDVQGRVGLAA